MSPEAQKRMDEFLGARQYDKTGDWRKTAATAEDPDDDPEAKPPDDKPVDA